MKIVNTSNNVNIQKTPTGKKVKNPGINTTDVFTPSSNEKTAFKNLPTSLNTGEAGEILLKGKEFAEAISSGTVEKPLWRNRGGITINAKFVYDSENKALYAGVEEAPLDKENGYWLTSFNPDGSVKWKFKGDRFLDGPVLDKDKNIYFCGSEHLHAIDKDGKEKWSIKLDNLYKTGDNPVVSPDGTVFVVSPNDNEKGETTKINAVKDGKILWTYNTKGWYDKTNSMLVGKDGTLYVAAQKNVKEKKFLFSTDKTEYCLIGIKPDGSEKFRVPTDYWGRDEWNRGGKLAEGPDGTVYTAQDSGRLVAYSPDGKEKFRKVMTAKKYNEEIGISTRFPPRVDKEGNVYFAGRSNLKTNTLVCMDKDGNEKWRKDFDREITTPPRFLPNGYILIGLDFGKMQVLNKNGNLRQKYLIKGGEYKNRFYGNIEKEKPIYVTDFTSDEEGRIFTASYQWVSAYDLNTTPLEQALEDNEAKSADNVNDSTIKVEEENVVIGGVTLKKNKVSK